MARLSRTLLIVAVALAAFLATTASAQDITGLTGGSSSSGGSDAPVPTVQCKVRNCAMCVPGQDIACYKCNDGYRVIEKTYLCGLICRVANCAECTSNLDVCQSCNPGYNVNKKGQCTDSTLSAAPAPAALWVAAGVAVVSVANFMVL